MERWCFCPGGLCPNPSTFDLRVITERSFRPFYLFALALFSGHSRAPPSQILVELFASKAGLETQGAGLETQSRRVSPRWRLLCHTVTFHGDAFHSIRSASAPRRFCKHTPTYSSQALAEALSNYHDIDRALAAYNAARQPLSERIVLHGRKLGMQLGVGIETDEDRRFAKSLQSPNGILDWIAVPNFLAARS